MLDSQAYKRSRARYGLCALAVVLPWFSVPSTVSAGTIRTGNVTTILGPTFFLDDAANSGTDTDYFAGGNYTNVRTFGGLLNRNQGPTQVTFTGLGFAAHTSTNANSATNVNVSIIYYGEDGKSGGADDVFLGTRSGTYHFTGGGEYVFAFDTPLSTNLPITERVFGVVFNPSGTMKLKSGPISYQTNSGPRLSVAGVAAPVINPQRVNLAKYQTVTASSTAGNRLASYATDGDAGNDSRWQSQNWAFNNARIDFPFPVEVGSAQVFMGIDDTLPLAQFSLQHLVGTTWTTISGANVTGNTNVERNIVFPTNITATSFRIIVNDPTIRLREFALYPPNGPNGYPLGTDLNLNLALQRPAVASSHASGHFPLHAVDGRTHDGSSWQTTTPGVNTLDLDLVASTKIGSVHLYSGSATAAALADFTLKSWNGTAWVDLPGGVVTGNTSPDRVIKFSTPVTTIRVRLEFTKTGTTPTVIRELQVFPANTGNVGYAPGTNINPSGAYDDYEKFHDAFYRIRNVAANRDLAVATGGQPALEPAGITTAQAQYQVLLNLADGTYRLRNRETGECLSGAQLSKAAGAILTDEPYRALPHQDWILEPLGGGHYRIINAWSGLAIDTQAGATAEGTALIQNAAGSATTQRWIFDYDTWAPKKGLGHSTLAAAFGATWVYNWGPNIPANLPENTVFNPMQWGNFNWVYNTGSGPIWQRTSDWRKRGDGMIVMGFNEPDRTDQANIAVADAVNLWPQVMALNQPLAGPSPADDGTWLTAFTTAATNRGFRWDYTAIHDYPGPNGGSSDGLIGKIQRYFNDYSLPVWLTEFSFVDWAGNQSWSEEDCYQALAEFIWRAENFAPLRKYALFVFTEDDSSPQPANSHQNFTPAPRSNSYDKSGKLTAFGRLYAAWDSDTTVRPDKTYLIHNRALHKRMANAATGNTNPGGRTIRTDGQIVSWSLVSAGSANRYYIVSSMDGRRLSHTSGNGAPTFVAADTTGVNVQWSLTQTASQPEKGWYYIGHPNSGTRLRLASFNTSNNVAAYQMTASSTTDENTQWRFIVPLPDDSAPVFEAIPDQEVDELKLLTFTPNASNPSQPSEPLIYSLVSPNPPWGASINATTGEFRWTPTETQGDGSTYEITIRASNGQSASDRTVKITVNEVNVPPLLATIPPQAVNEGTLLTFTAAATDADAPANTLTYSLVNAPAGAAIDASSGVFTWTPTEAQGPGSFSFNVRVRDGALTHDRPVSVTVNEVNVAPILAPIPPQATSTGAKLTFTASATDADLPLNGLVYSLVSAPDGAAIDSGTGVFTWTPTEAQGQGTFEFAVWVSDGILTHDQHVSVMVAGQSPSPTTDSDNDGMSDLLEHAFGTNPGLPNTNPFRVISANHDGTVTLQLQWNRRATGLAWQVRHGQHLADRPSWPIVAPGTTTTVRDGDLDRITITPVTTNPARGFYILEVIVD